MLIIFWCFALPTLERFHRNLSAFCVCLHLFDFSLTLVHFHQNSSTTTLNFSLNLFDFLHSHWCIVIKIRPLCMFHRIFLTFCTNIGGLLLKFVCFSLLFTYFWLFVIIFVGFQWNSSPLHVSLHSFWLLQAPGRTNIFYHMQCC